jgi:hypothetical protein
MQFSGFKAPLGVLYDSDFGTRIGSALGLCLLYGLDGKNECRVTSISVSKPSLRAAGCAEIFGRFYAGAVSGAFGAVGRNLPTGLADGNDSGDTPIIRAVLDKKDAEGKLAYEHGLKGLTDTAEPAPLLRNALTAQADQNCVVVLNGPATNLAKLLDLPGAKAWIERKARMLVMVDGVFGRPEHRVAARRVLADWPGPVVFVPGAVGQAVRYPAASIETDFAWATSGHPLQDAYRAAAAMPYDADTRELAAVLFAVREKEKLFGVSEAGTVTIGDDGTAKFAAGTGQHRQLMLDAGQQEKVLKSYIELVSAKPVPRTPRFRPQQNQQAPPAKPAAVKPEPPKP